jgi:hypothetical protein
VHRKPVGPPGRGSRTRMKIDAHLGAHCVPVANRWPLPPFSRQRARSTRKHRRKLQHHRRTRRQSGGSGHCDKDVRHGRRSSAIRARRRSRHSALDAGLGSGPPSDFHVTHSHEGTAGCVDAREEGGHASTVDRFVPHADDDCCESV